MSKVYGYVTEKVISMLKDGVAPWQRPWVGGGTPINYGTGRAYRGVNIFILNVTALEEGYNYNQWLTWNQVQKMGGRVKEGEARRWQMVVYWHFGNEKNEQGEIIRSFAYPLYYKVYNIEQCEGLPLPDSYHRDPVEAIAEAEDVIENMPDRPEIQWGGGVACYRPHVDIVNLPSRELFVSPEAMYSAAFHELAHATGHPSRLNRFEEQRETLGANDYSFEELVAQLTSSMVSGALGIDSDTNFKNDVGYIGGWLKALENNVKWIVMAASKAQKAADYILGIKKNEDQEDTELEADLV